MLELISEMLDDILRGIHDGFDLIFGCWPEALNPPNGWGSYGTCLSFLRNLRADFAAHPRATVKVWR